LEAQAHLILQADEQWRHSTTELQKLQQERNQLAKQMGSMADKSGPEFAAIRAQATSLKTTIAALEEALAGDNQVETMLAAIPNLVADDVPEGPDETHNQVVRESGNRPSMAFTPKQHFELGEA